MRSIDISQLDKLKNLLDELDKLKKQLESYTSKMERECDSVRASSLEPPYGEYILKIGGISNRSIARAAEEAKSLYYAKLLEVNRAKDEAEAYISTLPDAKLRLILQGIYVNHLTWREIEQNFGISKSTANWKYHKWRIEQEKSYLNG